MITAGIILLLLYDMSLIIIYASSAAVLYFLPGLHNFVRYIQCFNVCETKYIFLTTVTTTSPTQAT